MNGPVKGLFIFPGALSLSLGFMMRQSIPGFDPCAVARKISRPLAFGLAGAFLVAIYSLSLPNTYRSEVQVLPVESKVGGLGSLASTAASLGLLGGASEGGDGNFVEILTSRWVQERLLQTTYAFHDRAWRFGAEREHRKTLLDYLKAKNLDQGRLALNGIFRASRDMKTRVLHLTVETGSPDLACKIAQDATRLLEEFSQFKGQTRGKAKARFTASRLKEAEVSYTEAERNFAAFAGANKNYRTSLDPQILLKGTRLESELKLRQQLVATLALSHEQALMDEKNDMPIVNVLDEANFPQEKSGPSRARLVLGAFIAITVVAGLWFNRQDLASRFFPADPEA